MGKCARSGISNDFRRNQPLLISRSFPSLPFFPSYSAGPPPEPPLSARAASQSSQGLLIEPHRGAPFQPNWHNIRFPRLGIPSTTRDSSIARAHKGPRVWRLVCPPWVQFVASMIGPHRGTLKWSPSLRFVDMGAYQESSLPLAGVIEHLSTRIVKVALICRYMHAYIILLSILSYTRRSPFFESLRYSRETTMNDRLGPIRCIYDWTPPS